MKFDDLYNKVFISEKELEDELDDEIDDAEIADPANFDDVVPAPLPEPSAADETPLATDGVASQSSSMPAGNISDYINELEDFANKLNGTESNSLQSLVSQLDRPGTPFDGISGRTRTEIVRVAETLRSISENLKSFIINAAKK